MKYWYEVLQRAAELGGGWSLTMFEDGVLVGCGVFPVSAETSEDDAHFDALEAGDAWLSSVSGTFD